MSLSVRAVGLAPALRRAAFAPKPGTASPALVAAASLRSPSRLRLACRAIQTESLPSSASQTILNEQRAKRPSSPHFTIYQPQLTWLGSIAHRVAGAGLSALLYGFALAYLVAPGTFDSAHVIAFVAGLPASVKTAAKVVLAAPFAFHGWNGVRHLTWDLGKFVTVKGAYRTGYAVLGATALSTVYLVWF